MDGTKISHYYTVGREITLPSENPVLVTAHGTIITTGAYAIYDATSSPGKITNHGVLESTSTSGVGVELRSGGKVHNFGLISGGADGVYFGGGGDVTNYGTISGLGASSVGVYLREGGRIDNGSTATTGGSISGGADGILIDSFGGKIENFGTITGIHNNGVEIDRNDGGAETVVNGSGALSRSHYLISGGSNGIDLGGNGIIMNDGEIIGKAGDGVFIGGAGRVSNGDSTHLGRLIRGGAAGIVVEGGTGSVTNFGTIIGIGITSVGVYLREGGTIENGSAAVTGCSISGGMDGILINAFGGKVDNFGDVTGIVNNGIEIDGNDGGKEVVLNGNAALSSCLISGGNDGVNLGGDGTVTNYGVISGASGVGVQILGSGTITNGNMAEIGCSISGGSYGIYIGHTGNVANFGTITGTGISSVGAYLDGGGNLNNGSMAVTGTSITGGADGVLINAFGGKIENFGTISGGSNNGVEIDGNDGGREIVQNGYGTLHGYKITGGNNGVAFGGDGTVINDGDISGTNGAGVSIAGNGTITNGTATQVGLLINGGAFGVYIGHSGSVTNFGTISGTGVSSIGVYLTDGGTLVNGSSAYTGSLVRGGEDGVFLNAFGGRIENFGTIVGASNYGVEIAFNDGGTDTVVNANGATITGNVGVEISGAGEVTNDGTIVGTGGIAVQFSGAGETLVVDSGAVFDGIVDGGGGTNTLELAAGAGSITGIGSEFINFHRLAIDIGASWSLSGTISAVLNNGDVTISASATLDVTGSIDAGGTGIFNLSAGATLKVHADIGSQDRISFLANAELIVDNSSQFGTHVGTGSYLGPEIENFAVGDMIDLQSIAAAGTTLNYTASTGLLQVTNGGQDVSTLFFQNSSLGSGSFHVTADNAGHVLITHS